MADNSQETEGLEEMTAIEMTARAAILDSLQRAGVLYRERHTRELDAATGDLLSCLVDVLLADIDKAGRSLGVIE